MVQKGIKMDIIKKIAEELQIRPDQVKAVVNLIDEGNTIPFIARYRKEAHGALNDEILRNLDERLTYLRNLEEKKSSVLASMEELGVLTDDLKKKMEQAQTLAVINQIYNCLNLIRANLQFFCYLFNNIHFDAFLHHIY